jgi:LysR family transcriptional regulator, glycine cleavage system transcriptional activator
VDAALPNGDGYWPGLDAITLCRELLTRVCSPKPLSGRNRITRASDLLKLPLLRLDSWTIWSKWFESAAVSASVPAQPGAEPSRHAH